jgi:hypothetical protein
MARHQSMRAKIVKENTRNHHELSSLKVIVRDKPDRLTGKADFY